MTIIIALIIFGVLIFVHEFGHFSVAKSIKVKVHEFSVGMGPAIFKKQKGETLYSVRALPIGGFVKLEGEDEPSDDENAFNKKPALARIAVLVAGAFMNILLGFIIYVLLFSFVGQIRVPIIDNIVEGSPAYVAGLQSGDKIVSINGSGVNIFNDLSLSMYQNKADTATIEFLRDDNKQTISLTPVYNEENKSYKIGFNAKVVDMTPGLTIKTAYYNTFYSIRLVYVSLFEMITGHVSLSDVSGPVGIVSEIGKAAKQSFLDVLNIAGLIAVNLGVMNLLPLPALDGGRIFFILIEMIRRKPIKPEHEGMVHFVGLVLLLLLMVIVTFSDILKF